ncbi:MAG TPA: hypothetical protein VGK99_12500 [Acidobacteriota bacterium]|jgi:hypothetical protein
MAPRILAFLASIAWLVSFWLMLNRTEPFYTHFYSIAWWCYILLLASLNEIRAAESSFRFPSLFRAPFAYCLLVLFSAAFWFVFELYNVRLHNWIYRGVPMERAVRWPGYFISFGTVLPGVFETVRWLEGRFQGAGRDESRQAGKPQVPWKPHYARIAVIGGIVMMILPLVYPALFFPVVWGGLVFILDPWMERLGETNLVANLFFGNRRTPVLLLASGLICGFFWEFWNYWAGAKWVYSLPYLQFPRIFEMPLAGYLGFPPFTMECWLTFAAARYWWLHRGWLGRCFLAVILAGVCVAGIYAVDHFTIREYRPPPPTVSLGTVSTAGVSPRTVARLHLLRFYVPGHGLTPAVLT